MNPAVEAPLLTEFALPIRLAAGFVALWCGALLALTLAQRVDGSDARVEWSRLLPASTVVGACTWAAVLCVTMGMAGASRVPLGGAALALFVSIGATAIAFAGGLSQDRRHRWPAAAGGAVLMLVEVATLAASFGWKTPGAAVLGVALAATASQLAAVLALGHWQRKERDASMKRSGIAAVLLGVVQALPIAVLWIFLPRPDPGGLAGELLLALLAAGMSVLALQSWRMERHLVGRHEVLGAQLQQAHAHLERTPLSDPLTGLLSRLGIEASLRKAAMQAENQGRRVALLMIGLDDFKSVNDSFGHALGGRRT